jgi:hypothetical protein
MMVKIFQKINVSNPKKYPKVEFLMMQSNPISNCTLGNQHTTLITKLLLNISHLLEIPREH